MLDQLQGDYEVHLDSIVERVSYTREHVTIFQDGQTEETFDSVIVTVPLGVLKQKAITFEPELPLDKREAIERMGMGTLDKLYLLFEDVFWDESATVILTPENNLPRGHFNYWINFSRYLDKPIIMAFNAGKAARQLGLVSDQEIVSQALSTLNLAYTR